ncbi:MAG: ferrous iron transport protein A [Ruminococcus sp.]|nr:ferrous iron transport protein A [Ruminococcus sp.]
MMPLNYAEENKVLTIKKLGGSPEIRQHLENLGFTVGGTVTLINILGESVIVKVKESRVAIGADMARRIMV